MPIDASMVNQDLLPHNTCFGCGHANPDGFHLSFTDGQLVALAVLLLVNLFGEFRSISNVIEKVPGLRHLDSLGRPG